MHICIHIYHIKLTLRLFSFLPRMVHANAIVTQSQVFIIYHDRCSSMVIKQCSKLFTINIGEMILI